MQKLAVNGEGASAGPPALESLGGWFLRLRSLGQPQLLTSLSLALQHSLDAVSCLCPASKSIVNCHLRWCSFCCWQLQGCVEEDSAVRQQEGVADHFAMSALGTRSAGLCVRYGSLGHLLHLHAGRCQLSWEASQESLAF